ncbi:MAG: hypothetical protein HZY76_15845 [Anaerolineae bacterium]|nr:MAG: hypothetical protein HZY76_15845 [Anaerolineae bacterium]
MTSATVAPVTPTTLALALVEATAAPTAAHTSTPAPTARVRSYPRLRQPGHRRSHPRGPPPRLRQL